MAARWQRDVFPVVRRDRRRLRLITVLTALTAGLTWLVFIVLMIHQAEWAGTVPIKPKRTKCRLLG